MYSKFCVLLRSYKNSCPCPGAHKSQSSFQQTKNYKPNCLLPDFVNKVLLDHFYTHSFKDLLWLFLTCNSQVESFNQRLYDLQSMKYLLPGPFMLKSTDSNYKNRGWGYENWKLNKHTIKFLWTKVSWYSYHIKKWGALVEFWQGEFRLFAIANSVT